MVKSLPKVLYHGLKILATSLRKSIQQEIQMSRELARIRYHERDVERQSYPNRHAMSLDEARKILDISELNAEQLERKFRHLFSANDGYKYLQSKVFRAKEVLDLEVAKSRQKEEKSRGCGGIKCLLFVYLVSEEKPCCVSV